MPQPPTVNDTPDRVIDDVFITPRVLDDGAFNSYTESLRALIRDAEERGSRLSSTTSDTQKLCGTIREAARQLKERTTLGGQIADLLDERTSRAETLIDRLASSVSNDKELERLADAVIERRRLSFEQRVADSIEGLFSRYTEAERRAEQAERRALDAQSALEEGERRLAELEPRIDSLSERVRRAISEAERSVEKLTSALATAVADARAEHDELHALTSNSIDRIKRAGSISLDQAERDVDALRHRSADTVRQTEASTDRAVTNALDAIDQLRTLADDITTSTDHDAASLERRLGPFRDMIDRADAALGDAERPGQLSAALERAEALRAGLETTAPGLAEQIDRAERVRQEFQGSLTAADQRLAAMDARRAEICDTLEREIEAIGGDLSPIERATAGLRLRLDQLEQRGLALAETIAQSTPDLDAEIAQLRKAADEVTNAALQRTEEAGMWLVKLIQRAEQLDRESSGD